MPLALDPEATHEIVLETDQGKPASEQPTFIARYLPDRKWRQLARLNDRFERADETDIDKDLDATVEALMLALVGWRNMVDPTTGDEIEFSREAISDVCTVAEIMELVFKVMSANEVGSAEKKGLESPSPADTEKSAKGAMEENQQDAPPNENRSSSTALSVEEKDAENVEKKDDSS